MDNNQLSLHFALHHHLHCCEARASNSLFFFFRPSKMAVSSLSPAFHPFPSPLRTTTTTTYYNRNSLSSISLSSNFDFASSSSTHRRPAIIVCSSSETKVNGDLSSEEKRVLLERYGFNSDDIISETSSKRRTKREIEKKAGKGNRAPREGPKPPRTTHKLLQVLGGTARRMKLLSPKGMDVRPMMEVVKGAAFDILQVAGGSPAFLRPGRWLDLYSGTGSVGIEALSRGCSEVHFVEMDPWVVSEVLKPNLEWTGFMDNSVIHTIRVESFLERAEQFAGQNGPFDYISVTPPYTAVDYSVLMNQIAQSPLIGENTFIVVEYALKTDMLDTCGSLVQVADRRFGRTHLAIYGPQWAQKKRKPKKSIRTIEERALLQAGSTH